MSKINARNKGNSYERKIAKEFKDIGYDKCVTSRLESKATDALKIDLCNTGIWSVQCKAVERLGRYHDILESMPKDDKINVVFHKLNRKGDVVAMKKEDFYKIISMLNDCNLRNI